MKLWAGRPKDASGNKVAPVEIPTEPVERPATEAADKPKRTRTPKAK